MKRPFPIIIGITIAVAIGWLASITIFKQKPRQPSLQIFCAAGLKEPIEAIAARFTAETGIEVQLQFGGTGTLLSQIEVSGKGDLFVAADQGSVDDAKRRGLIRETLPVLRQHPVIAVLRGNPKNIQNLDDLFRDDVRFACANPEAASIGKATKKALADKWEAFSQKVSVMKPTVTEIAADVSIGAIDAAIIWNSTVPQFQGLTSVEDPTLRKWEDTASACVISRSSNSAAALRFARYLTAADKGGILLKEKGFEAIAGDKWSPEPELLLYSGAVNRVALEDLIRQFTDREGVKITTVYNGCGILCSAMLTMKNAPEQQLPDIYYACDLCFVPPVADLFPEAVFLTETPIVIAAPKNGKFTITTLADLAQPGLRLGICNAEQSTLGFLTKGILRGSGVETAVRKNVAVEVPTADFLINQIRAGGLDAAIVYQVNVRLQADHLNEIPILQEGAKAVQPFAVRANSHYRNIGNRLLDFLKTQKSHFEKSGFTWRDDQTPQNSHEIVIPDWLKQQDQP